MCRTCEIDLGSSYVNNFKLLNMVTFSFNFCIFSLFEAVALHFEMIRQSLLSKAIHPCFDLLQKVKLVFDSDSEGEPQI